MDILKQSLAPITTEAWHEINTQAKVVFNNVLTARRFVDVEGPKGIEYGGVDLGRLEIDKDQQQDGVEYGIAQVQSLVEVRKSFSLNTWELDNAARGAADIDLGALAEAARSIAEFEEKAIYLGLDKGCIKGLKASSKHEKLTFPGEHKQILQTIVEALTVLQSSFINGPYKLILGTQKWQSVQVQAGGYPLKRQIEDLIGGEIILNPHIEEGFLVPAFGGDFVLTLGQDLSIGYAFHSEQAIQLYFTESFTFRTLEPAAVVVFE